MIELNNLDLRTDAAAQRFVKDETVAVEFAAGAGELMSLEGPNRHTVGDALITGSTGDRWVVSRERFDAKYVRHNPASHMVKRACTAIVPQSCWRSGWTPVSRWHGRRRVATYCAARPATGSCNTRPATTASCRPRASRRSTAAPTKRNPVLPARRYANSSPASITTSPGTASPFAYCSSSEPSVASTYARSTAKLRPRERAGIAL